MPQVFYLDCTQYHKSYKHFYYFINFPTLDYCNSVITLFQKFHKKSKLIQNNAAKSLTGTGKRDYISPILASFHSFLLNSELNLNPSLALSDISKRLHLIILTDHRRQFPFRLQETGIISTFVVWCS